MGGVTNDSELIKAKEFIAVISTLNPWAELLRYDLEQKQISQRYLARKVGVTEASVHHWVDNERFPELKLTYKIARCLVLNTNEMLALIRAWQFTNDAKNMVAMCEEAYEQGDFAAIIFFKDQFIMANSNRNNSFQSNT